MGDLDYVLNCGEIQTAQSAGQTLIDHEI